MGNAKFVISLDFELKWGVFDALDERYDENILGVRNAIPKILELFEEYNIHATWATVGMLFCENKNDFEKYKPKNLPTYNDNKLNPYLNIKVGDDKRSSNLYNGFSMLKKIKTYPNQEIASHSYSHYNALAYGQTKEQFEDDIKSAVNIAKDKLNIDIKSYVFAKNEINEDYIKILKKYGIKIYRSAPTHKIYNKGQNLSLLAKVHRLADSYINTTGKYSSEIKKGQLYYTQGDRFLRPYKNRVLNKLILNRIKKEMDNAVKKGNVYHLWWHPHNFGVNLEENLSTLMEILKYYKHLNNIGDMESVCMQELTQ